MKIIAILNIKGGTGKTTTTVNLGCALAREGLKVVIVDADQNKALVDWREDRGDDSAITVMSADKPSNLDAIRQLAVDVVLIDAPGNDKVMNEKIIGLADAALIVLQPSGIDIKVTSRTIADIERKRSLGGKIEAGLLFNRVKSSAKLSQEALAGDWNEYSVPLLNSAIKDRTQYAQTMSEGQSIFDVKCSQGQAEFEILVEELKEMKWL